MKNIIFLFSLPRSGSTLLQRILMAHKEIHSVSEPWILLPIIYSLKSNGSFAEYGSSFCYSAIQDFIKILPNQEEDYFKAIENFAQSLYNKATNKDAHYFLDKTPRYYYIIPEITRIFPNAKFIFLFRNPLAIMASIAETWHKGKIRFGNNYRDIYMGPKLLANGYELLKEKSMKVNYENLAANPEKEIKKVFEYLNINYDNKVINNFFYSKLMGAMGDSERSKYGNIEIKLSEKWKNFYNTKFRQNYAVKYLDYLEGNVLDTFGYNKNDLIKNFMPPKNNYKQSIIDSFYLIREKIVFILSKYAIKRYLRQYYEKYQ